MILQGNQGQTGKQVGANLSLGFGEFSESLVSELQPRYYEQAYRGQIFTIGTTAGSLTAYTGAAGGTPLLAVWNPAGSGKNLVVLQASAAIAAASSVAGNPCFRLYFGPTAAITQATVVAPFSTISGNATGSVAKAYQDVATTSSTALNYLLTLGTYYWATAAGAFAMTPLVQDFSGSILVPPGNMIAVGSSIATATMTSLAADAAFIWSEVAI